MMFVGPVKPRGLSMAAIMIPGGDAAGNRLGLEQDHQLPQSELTARVDEYSGPS